MNKWAYGLETLCSDPLILNHIFYFWERKNCILIQSQGISQPNSHLRFSDLLSTLTKIWIYFFKKYSNIMKKINYILITGTTFSKGSVQSCFCKSKPYAIGLLSGRTTGVLLPFMVAKHIQHFWRFSLFNSFLSPASPDEIILVLAKTILKQKAPF